MTVSRSGLITGPGNPTIHLASQAPTLFSVCTVPANRDAGPADQTRDLLATIDRYLADAGFDRNNVMMAQVWLATMADHAAFVEAWVEWIDCAAPPALSVVGAPAARRDVLVEIRIYAARQTA